MAEGIESGGDIAKGVSECEVHVVAFVKHGGAEFVEFSDDFVEVVGGFLEFLEGDVDVFVGGLDVDFFDFVGGDA